MFSESSRPGVQKRTGRCRLETALLPFWDWVGGYEGDGANTPQSGCTSVEANLRSCSHSKRRGVTVLSFLCPLFSRFLPDGRACNGQVAMGEASAYRREQSSASRLNSRLVCFMVDGVEQCNFGSEVPG